MGIGALLLQPWAQGVHGGFRACSLASLYTCTIQTRQGWPCSLCRIGLHSSGKPEFGPAGALPEIWASGLRVQGVGAHTQHLPSWTGRPD